MAKEKKSYLQIWAQDWRGEEKLRLCSWEARYLWFEMLLLMNEAEERGFLMIGKKPMSEEQLARLISGGTPDMIRSCLFELETYGVFSRDRRGIIYSRKIVKGELRAKNLEKKKKQNRSKEGGKTGAEGGDNSDLAPPATHGDIKEISGSDDRTLGYPNSYLLIPDKDNIELSLSMTQKTTSDSVEKQEPKTQKSKPANRGTTLDENWVIPDEWGEWAILRGMTEKVVATEAAKFRDHHVARGTIFKSWRAAWQNWVRNYFDNPWRK